MQRMSIRMISGTTSSGAIDSLVLCLRLLCEFYSNWNDHGDDHRSDTRSEAHARGCDINDIEIW